MSGRPLLKASENLKRNPFEIQKAIGSVVQLKNTDPKWVKAMKLYPPTAPPLIHPRPSTTIFQSLKLQKKSPKNEEQFVRVNNAKRTYRPRYITKSKKISFPEDKLRNRFYTAHPLELRKPTSIVETEDALMESMDQCKIETISKISVNIKDFAISSGDLHFGRFVKVGKGPKEVTGESVVKFTQYLMNKKSMSRDVAYRRALSQFYNYKAKKELKQHTQMYLRKNPHKDPTVVALEESRIKRNETREAEYAKTVEKYKEMVTSGEIDPDVVPMPAKVETQESIEDEISFFDTVDGSLGKPQTTRLLLAEDVELEKSRLFEESQQLLQEKNRSVAATVTPAGRKLQ